MFSFHYLFQYFIISSVVLFFVLPMMLIPWNSIEEMNKVGNVVAMHVVLSALFMCFAAIWKCLLPQWKYVLSTPASTESKPSVETSKKIEIENSPPKYSELFEATYVTIKEEEVGQASLYAGACRDTDEISISSVAIMIKE